MLRARLKLIAVLNEDHVEVANCFCPGRLVREPYFLLSRAKKLLISTGAFQTLFIPCREMPEPVN